MLIRPLTTWGRHAVAAVGLAPVAPAAAVDFVPGSAGLGDPFFPNAGNGGYDATHYALTLSYEPSTNQLAGTALITATATQNLSSFDLDLRGFSISRLLVSGQDAAFARSGEQELVITPQAGLTAGTEFTVVIDNAGTPAVVTDPDQSIEGWVRPMMAPSWSASRRGRRRGTR
jgi:hypothetical protein